VAKKMNALSGFHVIPPDPAGVSKKIREGYRFIAYSLDILFLGDTCRKGVKEIRGR